MKIQRTAAEVDYVPALKAGSIHVIAFAEEGFSFFKAYAEIALGFSLDDGISFCNRINDTDETGTLWPRGNLTAMPKRFFREPCFDRDGFQRCLKDAFVANRDYCKSTHVVFQFFCVEMHTGRLFEEITEMARTEFAGSGIKHITVHLNDD